MLHERDKANFATLQRAFKNDDVALVECKDARTGEYAPVIAIMQRAEDSQEQTDVMPVARLLTSDPSEQLIDPVTTRDLDKCAAAERVSPDVFVRRAINREHDSMRAVARLAEDVRAIASALVQACQRAEFIIENLNRAPDREAVLGQLREVCARSKPVEQLVVALAEWDAARAALASGLAEQERPS